MADQVGMCNVSRGPYQINDSISVYEARHRWLIGNGPGSSQRLLHVDQEPKFLTTWPSSRIGLEMPAEMISDIEIFNYPGGACLWTP